MLNSWQTVLSVVCLSLSGVVVNGSTLEGKISGPDGQPIKGADVRLQNSSARLEAMLTKTDKRLLRECGAIRRREGRRKQARRPPD